MDKVSDELDEIGDELEVRDFAQEDEKVDNHSGKSGQPKTATNPKQEKSVSSVPAESGISSSNPSATLVAQDKPASDSRFFAIRTTGGQERIVANMLQAKMASRKKGVRSILVLDSFKGYIIVEATDSNVAYEALSGIRHIRGQIRGDLPFKDIEGYLVKKPVVAELNIDDTVEVVAGPFKSMKAKITRVDYEKQEATVVLLDSPYQIPVTVDANYLKKVPH